MLLPFLLFVFAGLLFSSVFIDGWALFFVNIMATILLGSTIFMVAFFRL